LVAIAAIILGVLMFDTPPRAATPATVDNSEPLAAAIAKTLTHPTTKHAAATDDAAIQLGSCKLTFFRRMP
jgi:hypothetical protein